MTDNTIKAQSDASIKNWQENERLAEAMIPLIGSLYRDRNVVASVYGLPIVNRSVMDVMKAHRFAKEMVDEPLNITETFPIINALANLPLGASRIDIGKLANKYKQENATDVEAFVKAEVAGALEGQDSADFKPKDVVLYGFGRIGRLLARILVEKSGSGSALNLRAVVVRKGKAENDLKKRASLLRRDSVHGPFNGTIRVDEEQEAIIANGVFIKIIYANSPAEVDYTDYGIEDALVVDNTGVWRDEAGLRKHLECAGASQVLLTAPGKGDIKNVVYGVNDEIISKDDQVLSAASCTTNAIVPTLKLIDEMYGIENGHVETVHSYTNDQNLIDNYHKGSRRGRSAALNMVITETGAAKAVSKALPQLEGKLTGNAIRVPTPNVSLAILNLNLNKEAETESLNKALRAASLEGPLRKQLDYINSNEAVSTDFVGSRASGVVDAKSTIANGKNAILYIWYDNEFGYSCQVVRMMQKIAGVSYPVFPSVE